LGNNLESSWRNAWAPPPGGGALPVQGVPPGFVGSATSCPRTAVEVGGGNVMVPLSVVPQLRAPIGMVHMRRIGLQLESNSGRCGEPPACDTICGGEPHMEYITRAESASFLLSSSSPKRALIPRLGRVHYGPNGRTYHGPTKERTPTREPALSGVQFRGGGSHNQP